MNQLTINKAQEIYNNLDDSKKTVVAFGMTPIEAAQELELYLMENNILYESKDLAVAFMKVANMPGNVGMRA